MMLSELDIGDAFSLYDDTGERGIKIAHLINPRGNNVFMLTGNLALHPYKLSDKKVIKIGRVSVSSHNGPTYIY